MYVTVITWDVLHFLYFCMALLWSVCNILILLRQHAINTASKLVKIWKNAESLALPQSTSDFRRKSHHAHCTCSGQQESEYSRGRHCWARGRWDAGNLGRVGQLGEGWGKRGQFTSNLRGRWTIPITNGGCQVSRGVYKGNTKGCKEKQQRAAKSKGECAMYICNRIVCATEWLNADWMTLSIVYIIITRMNVVDNLL